jgi:DNA-binding NtrC family response regulator
VNCGAIPSDLAESELFGHEKGAFTGAHKMKRGLLELAEGGTVLLNEIGDLHLAIQVKLLTFLDTFTFTRVGGENTHTVNVRVMAATNRDLEADVKVGRFRRDLFYRLNVLPIKVPSLRDIPEDIPIIASRVLDRLMREMQLASKPEIRPEEMERLLYYPWPGNIRELRNVLERSIIVSDGPFLRFDFLDPKDACTQKEGWIVEFPPHPSLPDVINDLKRQLIEEALTRTHGVKKEAAVLLGISRWTLLRQMTGIGMHAPGGRRLKEDDRI